MAKKTVDAAAAKAKKQKIILIAGGVLLLGLGAMQGPKLLKHGQQPAAAPAAAAPAAGVGAVVSTTSPAGTTAAAATATAAALPAGKTAGTVAGVPLPAAATVHVATSQLASFTLFDAKDPFVQKVDDSTPDQAAADAYYNANGGPAPAGKGAAANGSAPGDTQTVGSGTTGKGAAPAPAPPVVYATIDFDGKPQQLKVKDEFPASEPMFVLRSLQKKQAKIGVAGGSFDDGQSVTLRLDKKLTLVNTATGVRYELELVYTGAAPEVIKGFTTAPAQTTTTTATTTTTTAK